MGAEGRFAGPTGCLMKAGSERRAVGGGEITPPKSGSRMTWRRVGKRRGDEEGRSRVGYGIARQGYAGILNGPSRGRRRWG